MCKIYIYVNTYKATPMWTYTPLETNEKPRKKELDIYKITSVS